MLKTIQRAVERGLVRYRRWRLPEHAVHRNTEALFDEVRAELSSESVVCLDDFGYGPTTTADAKKTLRELEEMGWLEAVDGEPDTWRRGPLLSLHLGESVESVDNR